MHPGAHPSDPSEAAPCLAARFMAVARAEPGRLAVAGRGGRLSYRELADRVARLAGRIHARSGPGDEPVAVLAPLGVEAVAAALGILAAGKVYLPLDPHAPPDLLARQLEDSGATLVLADPRSGLPPGLLRLDPSDPGPEPPAPFPPPVPRPDRGACLLYTSGTTGAPKGVLHGHANLLFEVGRVVRAFPVGPADRLALLHPLASAASLRRLFPALLTGASLHLYDLKAEGLAGLPAWFADEGITIANGRRLLRDCADALASRPPLPALRLVTFGGEPVYPRDVELYRRLTGPACRMLVNLCTTETGSDRHFWIDKTTHLAGPLVPVGYPTEGTDVVLLDPDRRPVGTGAVGEIATRSRHHSLGYWRDPALTAARFLPDPDGSAARLYLSGDLGRLDPDGCLWFLGRKDRQLKIRGQRVEALAVEGSLLGLGCFQDACVLGLPIPRTRAGKAGSPVRAFGPGDPRLVAFVVPVPGVDPDLTDLRARLGASLPAAAVPSLFVRLDRLPRTPAGKVDTRALAEHFLRHRPWSERQELAVPLVPPRNSRELALVGLWRETLAMDELGIHDSFFELGGDSLMALGLLARIQSAFGAAVPMERFLADPTVAGLGSLLADRGEAP